MFHPSIFSMRISYRFVSNVGETFEADLTVEANRIESSSNLSATVFTNEDIIPGGVGITTEDYVIGIVLKQMGENYSKVL